MARNKPWRCLIQICPWTLHHGYIKAAKQSKFNGSLVLHQQPVSPLRLAWQLIHCMHACIQPRYVWGRKCLQSGCEESICLPTNDFPSGCFPLQGWSTPENVFSVIWLGMHSNVLLMAERMTRLGKYNNVCLVQEAMTKSANMEGLHQWRTIKL